MPLIVDIRRRAKLMLGPLLGACIACYFGYHLLNGNRSMLALIQLDQEIALARDTLAEVHGERDALERRASLLRPEHLDADMLEEQARRLLNVGRPGDLIVVLPLSGSRDEATERLPGTQPAMHRGVNRN
ncbi:MAG: septum formation initiator family protein [Alphaproteobacteria bacterium]|nr:septum formation initiator family protein [Alphaproteobacteria bacterium]